MSDTQSRPVRRRVHRPRRRLLIGVGAAALTAGAVTTLVTATSSGEQQLAAAVNPNSHVYQEPEWNNGNTTQVLMIRSAAGNGLTPTAVNDPAGQDSAVRLGIYQLEQNTPGTKANLAVPTQLWEWVPDERAKKITDTGYASNGGLQAYWGELVNRQTGQCLDLAGGNTNDEAPVGQWDCNGGDNQRWTAIPDRGARTIVAKTGFTPDPATWHSLGFNAQNCQPTNEGDLKVRIGPGNTCSSWNINQASYSFASNIVAGGIDEAKYRCLPGWKFFRNGKDKPYVDKSQIDQGAQLFDFGYDASKDIVKDIDYTVSDKWTKRQMQVILTCQPT